MPLPPPRGAAQQGPHTLAVWCAPSSSMMRSHAVHTSTPYTPSRNAQKAADRAASAPDHSATSAGVAAASAGVAAARDGHMCTAGAGGAWGCRCGGGNSSAGVERRQLSGGGGQRAAAAVSTGRPKAEGLQGEWHSCRAQACTALDATCSRLEGETQRHSSSKTRRASRSFSPLEDFSWQR